MLLFGTFMTTARTEPDAGRTAGTLLHEYPPQFRYFDMLVSAFVAILLISNIVAPKFVAFGPLRLSGAQLLFPLTYIFGDVFTEVYGYAVRGARSGTDSSLRCCWRLSPASSWRFHLRLTGRIRRRTKPSSA